jgi:glutamine synthetase
MPTLYN